MIVKRTVTQDEIVMLALARVRAAEKKVYSEHIAAEAHQLAPEVFGWELPEYRQRGWPDKEKVRIALIRLRSEHSFVDGGYSKETSEDGWQLTPIGVDWLQENAERVASVLKLDSPNIPKRRAADFLKTLKRDPLFKAYRNGTLKDATIYQFTDMLSCSPDVRREVITSKFDRLLSMARLTKDQDIIRFLDGCAAKFSSLLEQQVAGHREGAPQQ